MVEIKTDEMTEEQQKEFKELVSDASIANYLWKQIPNRHEFDKPKEYWFKRGVLDAIKFRRHEVLREIETTKEME